MRKTLETQTIHTLALLIPTYQSHIQYLCAYSSLMEYCIHRDNRKFETRHQSIATICFVLEWRSACLSRILCRRCIDGKVSSVRQRNLLHTIMYNLIHFVKGSSKQLNNRLTIIDISKLCAESVCISSSIVRTYWTPSVVQAQ